MSNRLGWTNAPAPTGLSPRGDIRCDGFGIVGAGSTPGSKDSDILKTVCLKLLNEGSASFAPAIQANQLAVVRSLSDSFSRRMISAAKIHPLERSTRAGLRLNMPLTSATSTLLSRIGKRSPPAFKKLT
jgi:hypothetical protein